MAEYIEKRKVVNLLIELENEFQQFKPFKGFEHAMYRKLCETKIAIEKLPAAPRDQIQEVSYGGQGQKTAESLCREQHEHEKDQRCGLPAL